MAKPSVCLSNDAFLPILSNLPISVNFVRSHWRSNLAREYGCYLQFCLLTAISSTAQSLPRGRGLSVTTQKPKGEENKDPISNFTNLGSYHFAAHFYNDSSYSL